MQPRLVVKVLSLKPQVLLDFIDRQLLNRSPGPIGRLPNDLAITVGQLQRRTNLISMEVIKLLFLAFSLIDPRQWRITTRLIQVQTALPRHLLPQHPQALPEEMLLFLRSLDLGGLGNPSS
ncbi:hypothetical protein D3C77_587130 [compost metagenome]